MANEQAEPNLLTLCPFPTCPERRQVGVNGLQLYLHIQNRHLGDYWQLFAPEFLPWIRTNIEHYYRMDQNMNKGIYTYCSLCNPSGAVAAGQPVGRPVPRHHKVAHIQEHYALRKSFCPSHDDMASPSNWFHSDDALQMHAAAFHHDAEATPVQAIPYSEYIRNRFGEETLRNYNRLYYDLLHDAAQADIDALPENPPSKMAKRTGYAQHELFAALSGRQYAFSRIESFSSNFIEVLEVAGATRHLNALCRSSPRAKVNQCLAPLTAEELVHLVFHPHAAHCMVHLLLLANDDVWTRTLEELGNNFAERAIDQPETAYLFFKLASHKGQTEARYNSLMRCIYLNADNGLRPRVFSSAYGWLHFNTILTQGSGLAVHALIDFLLRLDRQDESYPRLMDIVNDKAYRGALTRAIIHSAAKTQDRNDILHVLASRLAIRIALYCMTDSGNHIAQTMILMRHDLLSRKFFEQCLREEDLDEATRNQQLCNLVQASIYALPSEFSRLLITTLLDKTRNFLVDNLLRSPFANNILRRLTHTLDRYEHLGTAADFKRCLQNSAFRIRGPRGRDEAHVNAVIAIVTRKMAQLNPPLSRRGPNEEQGQ